MNNLFVFDNLKQGGGQTLGLNYFKNALKKDNSFFIVPDQNEYKKIVLDNNYESRIIYYSTNARKERISIGKILKIRKFIKKNQIKSIINFTNIPIIGLASKQYLMIHKAHLVLHLNNNFISYTFKQKLRLFFEKKYISFCLRLGIVNKTILQTEFMKRNFHNSYGKSNVALVVPSGFEKEQNIKKHLPTIDEKKTNLFVPTSAAKHKNIEYILKVSQLLKKGNIPVVFHITINKGSSFDYEINRLLLTQYIKCTGILSRHEMANYYKKSDAVFLPTLLESFCLPYVEAIAENKLIITSDLPFSREVCQESGIYFNPHEPISGFKAIEEFISIGPSQNREVISENSYVIPWRQSLELLLNRIEGIDETSV